MGAILKKTKVALAFFSALCVQHSPAQENEKPDQVRIIGHYENAVGTSDAASQGTITPQLIEARPMLRPGHLLYGFELFHNDGPWINPEDYRKLNGVLRFSEGTNADGYTLSLMGYTGKWNATDQIPQRAVDDGTISRFGAIDPSDGGKTSRYSVSLDRHKVLENGAVFHMDVYAIKYRLNLFSNFTYFLNNQTNGDQFEQSDDRTIIGLTPSWVFNGKWDEHQTTHKLGVDARREDTSGPLSTPAAGAGRGPPVRSDKVLQTGAGLYYENAIQWSDTFRSIAGVREDFYDARVDSDNPANSGTTSAHIKIGRAHV